MKNNNSSNGNADAQSYAPPVCQEFYVSTENMICTSPTEKVGETEGEW